MKTFSETLKSKYNTLLCVLFWYAVFSAYYLIANNLAEHYPIIPQPVSLIPDSGSFTISSTLTIVAQSHNDEALELITFISDVIETSWGVQTENVFGKSGDLKGNLNIILDEKSIKGTEEYLLFITPDEITIKANNPTGAFWGFQTLCQLVSLKKDAHRSFTGLTIPCATIHDFPRFSYRGLHLDVARHMFPVEFIKKYIDLMAFYKLNMFHWHLTDDQGWRIEIKSYPKLQEIAAYRKETAVGYYRNWLNRIGLGWLHHFDGTRYGGYYTQDEIKEIVAYARKRHITVIPEIELPGHCLAALAAYPELGCKGGSYQTATHWGIFDDIFCAGNEQTYEFLETVLTEVIDLFPSPFIHIGGDEVKKNRWKACPRCQNRMRAEGLKDENDLQNYFICRIEKFINFKNRQIMGWEEILKDPPVSNAIVMSWKGSELGIKAAQLGRYCIMTPLDELYFNYYQSTNQIEPLAIGKYIPLHKVYHYDPVPNALSCDEIKYILGAQANVWTEYLKCPEDVEYMVFPRAAALAETVWTPLYRKDYSNFTSRLKFNVSHLDINNINYAGYDEK